MQRLSRLMLAASLFVAVSVAVIGGDEQWAIACSCADASVYATYDTAGLAFIGTPTAIVNDSTGAHVTFTVTEWVKGTGGSTVELQMSQISGSLCGDLSVPIGQTIGVITAAVESSRPAWPQLCSNGVQTPALLRVLAAGELPEPDGSGPVAGILDLRHETGVVALLDSANRTLGYIDGLVGPLRLCPGGSTFTAGAAGYDPSPVQLVNLTSLSVRGLGAPGDFALQDLSCIDSAGTQRYFGQPWPPVCLPNCQYEYRQWDGTNWLVYPPLPSGQYLAENGLTVAVQVGSMLTIWSVATGTALSTVTLPVEPSWPTFNWTDGVPDLATVYLVEAPTLVHRIDTATGASTTITILDPPLSGGGQPLAPLLSVIDGTMHLSYLPESGGDDGRLWFTLASDGTLTPSTDPRPPVPSPTGGLFDLVEGGSWIIPVEGGPTIVAGACGTSAITIPTFDCAPRIIPPAL